MNHYSEQNKQRANIMTAIAASLVILFMIIFMIFTKQIVHANAIVITNAGDLQAMSNDANGNGQDYELGGNIDLDGISWEGIGSASDPFKGSLDGKGYTISNFKMTKNDSGLLNYASGSTIKNVTFENAEVKNSHNSRAAAIVASRLSDGLVENVTIKDSTVTGNGNASAVVSGAGTSGTKLMNITVTNTTVSGGSYVGMILATGTNAIIENSTAIGTVSSEGRGIGGLGGRIGEIKNSSADVNVISTYTGTYSAMAGGLAGYIYPGGISDSYATGHVTAAGDEVGGLAGLARGGAEAHIKNSYATGNVTGRHDVGGLVGYHDSFRGHEIHDSYSTGTVKGERNVGGFVGAQSNERDNRADAKAMLITKSYSTSNVQASGDGENVGGFIGSIEDNNLSIVEDSYARGTVTGKNNVGGFIGNNEKGTINRTYATGTISADGTSGGLVGNNNNGTYSATASPNFYDKETTNMNDTKGATGESTTNMQNRKTFTGWNFTDTWKAHANEYPTLRDEPFNLLTDIGSSFWGRDDITEIIENDIMSGSEDSSNPGKFVFRPSDDITRAEFAIVIVNALGESAIGSSTDFTDDSTIPSWAKAEVAKAKELGIVEGDSSGKFNPSNKISRAEIAVMIARAYDLPMDGFGGPQMFEDEAAIPSWAQDEIAATVAQQIMSGQESGGKLYFAPADQAMRVEAGIAALNAYKLD